MTIEEAGAVLKRYWSEPLHGVKPTRPFECIAKDLWALEKEGYVESVHDEFSLTSKGRLALSLAHGW